MKKFLTIALLIPLSLFPLHWHHPSGQPTHWLYAPGIFACERQMSKFSSPYNASTGEQVHCENNFEVIQGQYAQAVNFPDVQLLNLQPKSFIKQISFKPIIGLYYIMNMIAMFFLERKDNRDHILVTGSPNDSFSVKTFSLNFSELALGQEKDIATFEHIYNLSDEPMVLYGASRGAATIFNFIAMRYHEKSHQNVQALILESCFDSISSCFEHSPKLSKLMRIVQSVPGMKCSIEFLMRTLLPSFNQSGIAPINEEVLERFVQTCNEHHIPVLFVTSYKDMRVPSVCTNHLVDELKEAGLQDCYLLELEHSDHLQYMTNDEEDRQRYEVVVHAFYQHYDLSHNKELAAIGMESLIACSC